MYYEERVIDGVLCSKDGIDGEFQPFTAAQLTARFFSPDYMLGCRKEYLDKLIHPKWQSFGGSFDGYDEYENKDEESFCSRELNVPGTVIEVNGEKYIIGDVDKHGGTCGCCKAVKPNSIVTRYLRPPV